MVTSARERMCDLGYKTFAQVGSLSLKGAFIRERKRTRKQFFFLIFVAAAVAVV